MTKESATESADGSRLLIEILDIEGPLSPEIAAWVRTEVERRSAVADLGAVQAWLAKSDDTGELGTDHSRVVLLHHPTGPTGSIALADAAPVWLTHRHIYDATPSAACGHPDGPIRPPPAACALSR